MEDKGTVRAQTPALAAVPRGLLEADDLGPWPTGAALRAGKRGAAAGRRRLGACWL